MSVKEANSKFPFIFYDYLIITDASEYTSIVNIIIFFVTKLL